MCLIMSADSDRYSGIWKFLNNSTLLDTYKYPKTTTVAYNVLFRYKKPSPPRQVHVPPAEVTFFQSGDTEKIIQHQGMMGDPFQKLHAVSAKRRYIVR